LVPPSGHVIGVYARVDNTRGVHKAPANEEVEGITDLAVKLSDREQAILNPIGVNVIRDFRDSRRGLRVWGARCITSNVAWRYVPVRRLFIFVEESLQEGLQFVVFEPNSEALWAKVIRTVSGFLRRVWLDGALAGLTEEEAFQVRCDATTMTPDQIALGQLIVLVAIAPVHPAEFVIIRISQKTREAVA
jgi:phage tail sheath protein FI